jgi:hypothetical protein
MPLDEDKATYEAARGGEDAQRDLAFHYLDVASRHTDAEATRAAVQLAGTFAMLAASNGLVANVKLYARTLRAWVACGLDEKVTAGLLALIAKLVIATEGKLDDERVKVEV